MLGQMQILPSGLIGDKVDLAIRRLKAFEPQEGYYVAFSGAGVKFDAHYNVTSVDPPAVVQFIKRNYPDVHFDYPRYKDGKVVTMWNLIPRKQMPPTRLARYCCQWFKESSGKGRLTVTGVRWAESPNRAATHDTVDFIGKPKSTLKYADENGVEYKTNKHGSIILNDDNDDARRMVEHCYRTRKTLVNPIVDWEDEDVWEFLNTNGIEHCCLYDQGKRRIGCIGCPMGNPEKELEEYPKYRGFYIKAFDRMLENNRKNGIKTNGNWVNAESVMRWWLQKEEE